jgi:hypothetical protein
MRRYRELIAHAVLLAALGAASIAVATRGESGQARAGGLLVAARAGDVKRVVWRGQAELTVTAEQDAQGAFARVEYQEGAAAQPGGRTQGRFASVTPAERLLGALAPLQAERSWTAEGGGDPYGFEAPLGRLSVETNTGTTALVFGAVNGRDAYVRLESDPSTVHVLRADFLELLQNPTSLRDPVLHDFGLEDVSKVVLTSGGRSRVFLETVGAPSPWGVEGRPETADRATAWLRQMHALPQLNASERTQTELPQGALLLRLEYSRGPVTRGFLDVHEGFGTPDPSYWIRTERTRGYRAAQPGSVKELIGDVGTFMQ